MKIKLKCICGNNWIVEEESIKGLVYIECPKCKVHRKNPVETQIKLK
jgi:hypothetical protein